MLLAPPPPVHVGVMAAGARSQSLRVAVPRALGVRYVRPNVAVRIGGTNGLPAADDALARAGFRLVLNLNNKPGTTTGATPAVPPKSLLGYRKGVAKALDHFRPALAVVENEELAPKFYSGTPRQYLAQLAVAVDVAHKRRLQITNGGIVDGAMVLLTWHDLWYRGRRAEADAFLASVQDGRPLARRIRGDVPDAAHPDRPFLARHPAQRALFDRATELVRGYRTSKMDYVNFHWYQSGRKPLGQAIDYLQRVTGKRAVTNEIGQFDRRGTTVTGLLGECVAKRLPFTVWFGGDGDPAQGLFEPDGTLRPNGVAFRDFLRAHPSVR